MSSKSTRFVGFAGAFLLVCIALLAVLMARLASAYAAETPPTIASTSELADVSVKFWNMMDSTKFVPEGFTPAKNCDVTVPGYAVPSVRFVFSINDFASCVNGLLPTGWTASGTPVDGSGITTAECKVTNSSNLDVSVTWKFTCAPKLPCTSPSEYISSD